jgi:hypothetical protein
MSERAWAERASALRSIFLIAESLVPESRFAGVDIHGKL